MNQFDEVKKLFETELKARLLELEPQRLQIAKPIWIVLASVGGLFLLLGLTGLLQTKNALIGACVAAVICFIIAAIIISKKYKIYRKRFKEQVVSQVVRILDPDWNYAYDSRVSESTYFGSGLFPHRVDRYNGDDRVNGKIGKTDFEMSELHTEYKTVSYDSKGHRRETWHTIFRGLFFHADFNKDIKGKTFVLPDTAQSLFGSLGQSLQAMNKSHGELIKMEDIEFEKKFVVYGSDQIEPRYILTPKMMERLTKLRADSGHRLHLAFLGTRVYVAVSIHKALFEPRVFSSGVKFEDVSEMYKLFAMIQTIVEEMELNTRIWTKN
jgi:uncharacterized protein DUF3137